MVMGMAKCGDCVHFGVCEPYTEPNECFPEVGGCPAFKSKTDFVHVVRCKDCKFWRDDILQDEMKCCSIGYYMTKGDSFCSFGKKAEGE